MKFTRGLRFNFYLALVSMLACVGCASASPTAVTSTLTATVTMRQAQRVAPTVPSGTPVASTVAPASPVFGYTHQRRDGNRLVSGKGSLPNALSVEVPLDGLPRWVVAAPASEGSIWAVVLDDGRIQAFLVVQEKVEPVPITPDRLSAGMPPLIHVKDGTPELITAPSSEASSTTHPVLLPGSGRKAFIDTAGDFVLLNGDVAARLALNALPDARLLVDEQERLLLLTGATTRYDHGVLGDKLEASQITLIETAPTLRVVRTISIPAPSVVEGIAPIWADLTGDGVREIIVTVSNAQQGAQIVVFNERGEQIAAGPAIGRKNRWRHQAAVAPFGPQGELELVDVLTPHIGGVAEFYQLQGDTLRIVAQVPGYTSHILGSRNLDIPLAGDLDGDGRVELLLLDQLRIELGAIRRTATGAEVVWTLPVAWRVSTNLAAVTHSDGRVAVGAGREDQVLSLWLPPPVQ